MAPKAKKQTKPASSVIPPKFDPEACDPIYRLVRAHLAAHSVFENALEIPEIPQCEALRKREENRTSDLYHAAEHRLSKVRPKTLAGTLAALNHIAFGSCNMLMGMDDDPASALRNAVQALNTLLGTGPTRLFYADTPARSPETKVTR